MKAELLRLLLIDYSPFGLTTGSQFAGGKAGFIVVSFARGNVYHLLLAFSFVKNGVRDFIFQSVYFTELHCQWPLFHTLYNI